MVAGKLHCSDLTLISETIIKAIDHSIQPYILPLSNFDRSTAGFPVTIFYAYRKPSTGDLPSIITTIKTSLSKALDHFFPFSGRILQNSKNGEILCNNEGVRLVEASANFSLASLDFYYLDLTTKTVLLPFSQEFPLNVQVTSYTCGGFSISWTFDHQLADAFGFIKFLSSWCEIARTNQLSTVFSFDRSEFRPRSPPTYSALLDRIYTMCTTDDILNIPPNDITQKHLYFVKGSSLENLRAVSSDGGCRRTRTEALSAYLWKVMARTLDESDAGRCKMGWIVEGRRRMGRDSEAMSRFVGNLVSIAVREESVRDLKEGSLAHVAGVVSAAIDEVANRDHFLDLIDWMECHRPGRVLAEIVLGGGVPALVVNSVHNMPQMSMDFGLGLPSLGVSISKQARYGAGYVNLVSSGRDDGSWFVSATLWPKLAAALESDSDHIFQPITADHLWL